MTFNIRLLMEELLKGNNSGTGNNNQELDYRIHYSVAAALTQKQQLLKLFYYHMK